MIQREQASIFSFYERILLRRIAGSLPLWVTPDRLTGFGVFGAALCLAGYAACTVSSNWLWLANLGLLFHWFGDSLDGTLARVRQIERPNYGFYLDQTIDVIGNLLIAAGIGISPWVRMDSALFMLAAYHMLSIHTFVRSVVTRRFHVDVLGLGPTEMRVAIVMMNLAILTAGAPEFSLLGQFVTWCDVLVVGGAAALMVVFVLEVRKEAHIQLVRDTQGDKDAS